MTADHSTPRTHAAFCLGCGYSLRELPARRCPECGRPFDPADLRSMSLGHPLRPWQRWLLRPTGWPTIALALLGTAALAYLSRWPRLSPEPLSVLLDEFHWPRPDTMPPTALDVVFYVAVVLWAVFIAWTLFWQLALMLLVPRAGRRANVWQIDTRRRRLAIADAAMISIICMIFGWEQRVGRRWIARVMAPPRRNMPPYYDPRWDPWRLSPVKLSSSQAADALGHLIVDLPRSNERLSALGALVQAAGRAALPSLIHATATESDETLLIWELRLIGLCRDPQTAQLLIARLHDPRSAVRAATADAVGILRQPSYSVHLANGFWMGGELALDSKPPIDVGGIVSDQPSSNGWGYSGSAEHDLLDEAPITVDPAVRRTLEQMMLAGTTPAEREAAARSLVTWPPPHYQLRVAEWGVWINHSGQMALARSVLDEIPPFVHRTGNPTDSFDAYFLYPSMVTKPIVHLTSDVPLAVDVEAQISQGRPWFGYPMPDDFAIGGENVPYKVIGAADGFSGGSSSAPQPTDDFMAPAIPSLPDCREGYPWLVPHHRVRESEGTTFGGPALIMNLGLRWQSAIVCPNRLAWMAVPSVPPDPRFNWWTRLRDVPCDWVTSRGETERFLYYDGPTRATVPLAVSLEPTERRLHFATPKPPTFGYSSSPKLEPQFQPLFASAPANLPPHEGLYIEVHSGQVHAQAMEIASDGSIPLSLDPALVGEPAVAGRLRQMLLRYGLSGPEADGLIAAWTPQFFRAEGRRFLLRMSPGDYARQCPMQVRPTPTEVVRLGLVLTEFDGR